MREGRADKSKKPKIEIEISPEGEEEEGPEDEKEMDGGMKPPSRKRSAKGAKNTKAPMDAECGCKGKKGGKCDGNCGGSMSKRGDSALTPHEYLSACDLGIQDRSRSYIRARLDAAQRLDLKCGKGSISKGEKCTKGSATAAESAPISIRKGMKLGAKIGGGLGVAQGALGGAVLGGPAGALAGAAVGALGGALEGAVIGGGVQVARKAGAAYGRSRERNRKVQAGIAKLNPKFKKQYETAKARGASRQELTQLSIKQAGEIDKLMNKRRDSVYAAGFTPDTAALAI